MPSRLNSLHTSVDASTNMSDMSMNTSMDTTTGSASGLSLSLNDQSSIFSPPPSAGAYASSSRGLGGTTGASAGAGAGAGAGISAAEAANDNDNNESFNRNSLDASESTEPKSNMKKRDKDFPGGSSSGNNRDGLVHDNNNSDDNINRAADHHQQQDHQQQHSWSVENAKSKLRKAVKILNQRGLKLASKWAAEQLIGLAQPSTSPLRKFDFRSSSIEISSRDDEYDHASDIELYAKSILDLGEYHRAAAILSINPITANNASRQQPPHQRPTTKTNINGKTRGNTGGDLMIQPPLPNLSPYGIFLRAYALYMAGERRKEEEVLELRDPLERTTVSNSYLPQLSLELHEYYVKNELDAFGMYIYGVILKEIQKSPSSSIAKHHERKSPTSTILLYQQQKKQGMAKVNNHTSGTATTSNISSPSAHTIFIQSLIKYPYNWSAWMDLAEICIGDPSIHPDVDALLKPISTHWMHHFFCVHLFLENQANENAIMVMERLIQGSAENHGNNIGVGVGDDDDGVDLNDNQGFFVSSPYLQSQLAVAHYNMRDFDTAQTHFNICSDRDPHRLDQMDVYSNILYVKEDKVALSTLAHRAVKLDKYRPETCCIVGNYYSLKAQHEKAVQYFQRALKLDRTYLSAWTLMGHEYIEMKNTAAAIEAYRRAVDINASDYRAWYGLGQAYEILNMYLYALFYFQKAVELRPYDARMWCAMGTCYIGLERKNDAKRSYERAVANHDAEGIATRQLAILYREDGDAERAARCFLKHLELRYQAQLSQASLSSEGASVQTIISSINVDEPEAEALLNLAIYHRDNGEFNIASLCCTRLLDYPGPEKEEARDMLLEMRSVVDRNQN